MSPIAEITLAAALSTTTLGVESSFLVLSTTLTVDQDNNVNTQDNDVNTQTQLNPKTKSETMRLKSTNKNTPSLIRPHSVFTQACAGTGGFVVGAMWDEGNMVHAIRKFGGTTMGWRFGDG